MLDIDPLKKISLLDWVTIKYINLQKNTIQHFYICRKVPLDSPPCAQQVDRRYKSNNVFNGRRFDLRNSLSEGATRSVSHRTREKELDVLNNRSRPHSVLPKNLLPEPWQKTNNRVSSADRKPKCQARRN